MRFSSRSLRFFSAIPAHTGQRIPCNSVQKTCSFWSPHGARGLAAEYSSAVIISRFLKGHISFLRSYQPPNPSINQGAFAPAPVFPRRGGKQLVFHELNYIRTESRIFCV
jgi:hypothetical protein